MRDPHTSRDEMITERPVAADTTKTALKDNRPATVKPSKGWSFKPWMLLALLPPVFVLHNWLNTHCDGITTPTNLADNLLVDFICDRYFMKITSKEYYDFEMSRDSSPWWKSLYSLSYPVSGAVDQYMPQFGVYEKGPRDILFLAAQFVLLAVLQVVIQKGLRRFISMYTKDAAVKERFAEQGFLFMYYLLSFSCGLYIYTNQAYSPFLKDGEFAWSNFNFARNMNMFWVGYPHYRTNGLVKAYYLIQLSFWLQQLAYYVFVIPVKERRKDHFAMVSHHVVTNLLVLNSYVFHFTSVGNAVLIVMDTADVFLCFAKCLKYMGKNYQTICDAMFGMFVLSWIVTRHYLYFYLVYSIWIQGPEVMKFIYYDSYFTRKMQSKEDWDRPNHYFSVLSWAFFLLCFVVLQALLIYWFVLIIRVVKKVVKGTGADDVREDEDD